MSQIITQTHINQAMSYEDYVKLIQHLLSENKTTGENHSPAMIDYTKMNLRRMQRISKTIALEELLVMKLQHVATPMIWLVLTEAWCGDAAQNVPVLAKMADENDQISLKLILRDENLDVMDAYLTAGGRSIPKLICLTADLKELGTWGPRPQPVQQMVREFKQQGNGDYKKFTEQVQLWYARDKTQTMQREMIPLLEDWIAKS